MVKFSLNFLDFSRDLDNSDFFQYNFWVSFDGPSTYYIISRGRMGVGGSAKYKKFTKSEKRIHTFRPYRNFQNDSHRSPISTKNFKCKNMHDLMNISRFFNSYLVTIHDFCTHMIHSVNNIHPSGLLNKKFRPQIHQ